MITIEQCRAARGLLGWTQQDLADASGLSKTAINNFEKGHSDIKAESLRAIRMAFESTDVEFIGEQGLRKKSENVQILKGPGALHNLLDDIYSTLKETGGEILIRNMDERLLSNDIAEKFEQLEKKNVSRRIICRNETQITEERTQSCRVISSTLPADGMVTFIYGDKVAFELWDQAMIVIISSSDGNAAERLRFQYLWESASAISPDENNTNTGTGAA